MLDNIDMDSEKADIWYALSDLYLDNELSDADIQYIATKLANSGFSVEELEHILFEEVHPVLCWNLRQVAGHWGDFGRDWTVEAIMLYLNTPPPKSWLEKFRDKGRRKEAERLKSLVLPDWDSVKNKLSAYRVDNDK